MSRKANLLLRLRAALWCAAVAGALCMGYLLYQHLGILDNAGWILILFGMVPAGISGWLIGWHLLNPHGYHDIASAIGLGTAVVMLAYGILLVILPMLAFISAGSSAWAVLQDSEAASTYLALFCLLIPAGALILTGWITLPAGWLAAYLLSWRYRGKRFGDSPLQESQPNDLPNDEGRQEV